MSASTVLLASLVVVAAVLHIVRSVTAPPPLVIWPAVRDSSCGVQAPRCTCSKATQRAQCVNLGLPFIPPLPSYVTSLDFSNNSLPRLMKTVFSNIKHLNLTELILKQNGISVIFRDAFDEFPQLETLNLAANFMNRTQLKHGLVGIGKLPRLRHLDLTYMNLTGDPIDLMSYLNGSNLNNLTMNFNEFRTFDHSRLAGMARLIELGLRGFYLENFTAAFNFENHLEVLDLGWNVLREVPTLCLGGTAAYPNLTIISLDKNLIRYVNNDTFRCMQKLKRINLSRNVLSLFHGGFLAGMSGLRHFRANYLFLNGRNPRQFETFSNKHVRVIDLVSANIRFGQDIISMDLFKGCESLRELYLRRNSFARADDDFFSKLLGPVKNLTLLDLSSTELSIVPKVLTHLTKLEKIWLSDNFIIQWPRDESNPFRNLEMAMKISLDQNLITNIGEGAFPEYVVSHLRVLNLSGNPFSCSCDLLPLLSWMKRNRSLFFPHDEDEAYICASPDEYSGWNLTQLPFTESYCLMPEERCLLVIVIASLFIFIFTTFPLVFRYRWHIQSLIFMARYQALRMESERNFRYDAFLVYHESCLRRIRREFLPQLEQQRHLHLCVRDRDFEPGKAIVDDIVECMLGSRRVVALLSNALASDEWCQFQLQLAQLDVVEGGAPPPLLLLLEDIWPHNMTPTLFALLKTTAFLRYPSRQEHVEVFWQNVYLALTTPSIRRSLSSRMSEEH